MQTSASLNVKSWIFKLSTLISAKLLGWSKVRILLHAFGEKSLPIYLWGGLLFYAVTMFLKSLPYDNNASGTAALLLSWNVPSFLVIGFVHAVSLVTAKHMFHSAAPTEIRENWSEQAIIESLAKKREMVVEDFKARLDSMEEIFGKAVRDSLPPEMLLETRDTVQDISNTLYISQLRAQEIELAKSDLDAISVRSYEQENYPVLVITSFLLGLAFLAWFAHLAKLLIWSLGFVSLV